MTELPQTASRMPVPRRTLRRGVVAVVLAVAALVLAGCTTQDTAAVVDGQKISTSDVQTAAQEINEQFPTAKLTTSATLSYLIIAPAVLTAAEKAGAPQSADSARTVFTTVQDPSPAAVTVLQVVRAVQGLDDATRTDVVTNIGKLDVSVNPRFGTFDPKQGGLVPVTPDWVVPTPTATTTAPATP